MEATVANVAPVRLHSRAATIPGILLAVLVLVAATGSCSVGLYPYGTAVWLRPFFSLFGIAGAVMLLAGVGWWRIVLPVYFLTQILVIATDVSGPWFFQSLTLGYTNSSSVRMNNVLTSYEADGVNFAGLILFFAWLIVAFFKLHPRIRRPITLGQTKIVATLLAIAIVPVAANVAWGKFQQSRASFVLSLDLPNVPIYYKDQLLGRTPLAITPEKVRQWQLPLAHPEQLKMYSWGWGDVEMLSDGTSDLPLYAGAPWPFRSYLDTFDTPWGLRSRFDVSSDDAAQRQAGYLFPRADLRDEPILTITVVNSPSVVAGGTLKLHCVLTNPTARRYTGSSADLQRYTFSQERRNPSFAPLPPGFRNQIHLPPTWSDLPVGATVAADVDFDAPSSSGNYELFCTWFCFKSDKSGTGCGCYSNMLNLPVLSAPNGSH